jgi:predicted Rossmann-fold nucleotide-binding protein
MQAANEGALLGAGTESDCSVGLELPQIDEITNPYTGRVFRHGSFFSRLQHFILMSDAYIAFPGGIGTLLELSVVWQLLQVHQLYCTPLILVGGMWPGILEWVRSSMLESAFIDPFDLEIPRCVPDTEGALAIIQEYYQAWKTHHTSHSSFCLAPKPI